MGTHGTIRLTSKAEKGTVLLQTPHDGHTQRALKILTGDGPYAPPALGLPQWMAEQQRWRAETIANRYTDPSPTNPPRTPLSLETFQDWERCHATCEVCLIELAAWIVACCPLTYRVIPPLFQAAYLADYDRKESGHLQVVILDTARYRIKANKEHNIPKPITVDLIAQVHRLHLEMAEAKIREETQARKPVGPH
jgi:hypothetical protein